MKAVELLVWWVVLTAVWLGTLATAGPAEITVGIVGAGLGAGAAVIARHALKASWQPKKQWLRWAAALPGTLITDSLKVLFGRQKPTTRTLPVTDVAVAAAVINATPATVVMDAHDDTLVVHALGDKESKLEREIKQ